MDLLAEGGRANRWYKEITGNDEEVAVLHKGASEEEKTEFAWDIQREDC